MKEVSEEWQLKLFDLLEGNLTEAECTLLMKEIDNNPDLHREYNLLKATYLQPDETEVYAHKNLLLKQGSKGLWIRFNRLHYAAAASLLLLCGLGALMLLRTNQQPKKTQWTREIKTTETELSTATVKAKKVDSPIPNNPAPAKLIAQKTATWPTAEGKVKVLPSDSSTINTQNLLTAKTNINPRGLSLTNIYEPANLSDYRIWVYYPADVPISGTKKRTLSYKLLNTTRTMLATLNFPSISVKAKPVKGKLIPVFDIRVQLPQNENHILANYTE